MEGVEAGEVFRAEFCHGGFNVGEGFALHGAGFGVEFVGVADEALEFRFGDHLAESGTGVAFGHPGGPFGCSFTAQQVGAQRAVGDVRFGALAVDSRGIAEEDTDVVEHGGGFNL